MKLNKPVYVGMRVLKLSKHLMYNFSYNFLKPWYPDGKVRILYTDTDSFILEFLTDDIYDDMQDELGGKLMTKFVGLRSKLCSYTGEESAKRAKGVNRAVLRKISHDDYLE